MNKLFLLLLFILSGATLAAQQEYNNVDYKKYKQALDVFQKLDPLEYEDVTSMKFYLSGTNYYEGHYPTPYERRPYSVSEKIEWTKNFASSENTLIDGTGTLVRKEQITDDEILFMNYSEKELHPNTYDAEVYLPFYSPVFVYNDILRNKQSIRYMGYDEATNCEVIVYASSYAKLITVYINKDMPIIESAQILRYHHIEGNYYLQFFYEDYSAFNGIYLPSNITIKEWNEVKFSYSFQYNSISKKDFSYTPLFEITPIAKNVYQIAYRSGYHYSYVIDFGDYLSIIEAPVDEKNMDDLNSFITRHFDTQVKPVKYCFLTHHHPDHAGGFSYLYNRGATIVTTEQSAAYFGQLLNREYSLSDSQITKSEAGSFDIVQKDQT